MTVSGRTTNIASPRSAPIAERGYTGGISQLKVFLAPLKACEVEPLVRFETEPGQQMQADFTVVRRGRDPLPALVATLGYTRASFVKFSRRCGAWGCATGHPTTPGTPTRR